MPMHDEDVMMMMSLSETCAFFGGSERPIHYSTLYRVRWLRSECREARWPAPIGWSDSNVSLTQLSTAA